MYQPQGARKQERRGSLVAYKHTATSTAVWWGLRSPSYYHSYY